MTSGLFAAAGNPFDRGVQTGEARKAHRATPAGDEAQLRFRQADLGGTAHDAKITGQTYLQPAAHGITIDGDHRRKRQIFDAIEAVIVGLQVQRDRVRALGEHRPEFHHISADDESALSATEQKPANSRCRIQTIQRLSQLFGQLQVKFVDGFILQIDL